MEIHENAVGGNGMNGDFLTFDAVHPVLQGSFVTCLHCDQLLDENGLANHHVFKARGGMERKDEEIFIEKHERCHRCAGWVYPILNNKRKIKFFHKCAEPFNMPNKYICGACGALLSKRAFIHHCKDGCKKMCPRCNQLMFKKKSYYGVEVDHLCFSNLGGSSSTLSSEIS